MKKPDPIDLEHIEQTASTAGWRLIAEFLSDEAKSVIKAILNRDCRHDDAMYLRGYYAGLMRAIGAPAELLSSGKVK